MLADHIRIITHNTVVVGSGAAGLNAASRLYQYGQTDIALVTEGMNIGTSRNTGSDKQTYYKLTLCGSSPDSVREMAETLFAGQCVDGDHALCEAALSVQGFLRLVELGVPFPHDRYGQYVGYKTDHDPRCRATSVGPYTSREMTEALERAVRAQKIEIWDGLLAISILTDGQQAQGLLCLDCRHTENPEKRFVAFCCKNIVWATGGPAGIYSASVYPFGQYGATGTAFAAGVVGKNLTEWQFGLASVKPRWNVSGTYMQVLPRFISAEPNGSDEREFLNDFFADEGEMLTKIFLKGYQWPFDVRKVENGSSLIDILVYLEQKKGRRVYLDFRYNPGERPINFNMLAPEAREYLEKAGACFGTPLERLMRMNAPAVEFYRGKGVDLAIQPLEIALCAQHNNGGISSDAGWQANMTGLGAGGEAAASHGVYRPGGSALNAGQVGSTRAAQYISARRTGAPDLEAFYPLLQSTLAECEALCETVLDPSATSTVDELTAQATEAMSLYASAVRSADGLTKLLQSIRTQRQNFYQTVRITRPKQLKKVFRLRDILLCQQVYAEAMLDYLQQGGHSRGSALYTEPLGKHPHAGLPLAFTYILADDNHGDTVQEVQWQEDACRFTRRKVRPIPQEDDFFEHVWRDFRRTGNTW